MYQPEKGKKQKIEYFERFEIEINKLFFKNTFISRGLITFQENLNEVEVSLYL
jgi:hypothetical protein